MTAPGETITVPRPKPDEMVLAAVDEQGATVWVHVPNAQADMLPGFVPFLAEGQQILHEQREGTADLAVL